MDEGLKSHLCALELRLLEPEVRASRTMLEQLLDPAFVEFGASGRRFERAEIVADLSVEQGFVYEALDFEVVSVSAEVAQVRYRSITHCGDSQRQARRSSLWRHDGSAWRMLFHQGTVLQSC